MVLVTLVSVEEMLVAVAEVPVSVLVPVAAVAVVTVLATVARLLVLAVLILVDAAVLDTVVHDWWGIVDLNSDFSC